MPLYRKKPVVVEAIYFSYEDFVYLRHDKYPMVDGDLKDPLNPNSMTAQHPKIHTLEGDMIVSDGDWIIKGVNGEYYPCKPDIFNKTYERVE